MTKNFIGNKKNKMYITLKEESQHCHKGMYIRVQSLDTHTIRSGFVTYPNRSEEQIADDIQHRINYLKRRVQEEE